MVTVVNNAFWRLEPECGDDLTDLLESQVLTSPTELLAKVRRMDGIVLARWEPDEQHGRVHALGVVEQVDRGRSALVTWNRVQFTLHPSASGSTQWRTRPFFRFADQVAARYNLSDAFAQAFSSSNPDIRTTLKAKSETPNQAVTVQIPARARPSMDPKPDVKSPSPQCNRVAPDGTIFATPHRGMFMGNRTSPPRWLVCNLHFERNLREERKYTKLFFLDEAVALSAGHRPCNTCRRDRYRAYLAAVQAEIDVSGAAQLDALLDVARRASMSLLTLTSLPDGAVVALGEKDYRLIWRGAVHRWTPAGYVEPIPSADLETREATVLTPGPSLTALRNGYVCEVHASADLR